MDELNLIKELLGIDFLDASKDNTINHFLSKARSIIKGYCNIEELPIEYSGAVIDFAVYLYKNRDSTGIRKRSEGERTIEYEEGLPEFIKLALPLPRIKVGGY